MKSFHLWILYFDIYQLHFTVGDIKFISVSMFVVVFGNTSSCYTSNTTWILCLWLNYYHCPCEQQSDSQTLTNFFFLFQCLFVVGQAPVSSHLGTGHCLSPGVGDTWFPGEQKGWSVVTKNQKRGDHWRLWNDSEGGPHEFAWKMKTWWGEGIVKVINCY